MEAEQRAQAAAADTARMQKESEELRLDAAGIKAKLARVAELASADKTAAEHAKRRAETAEAKADRMTAKCAALERDLDTTHECALKLQQKCFYFAGIALKLQLTLEGSQPPCAEDMTALWQRFVQERGEGADPSTYTAWIFEALSKAPDAAAASGSEDGAPL